jgi:Ig-fold domain
VTSVPFPSESERNPKEWLYAAVLTGEGFPEDQAIWLFAPHRALALAKPEISITARNGALEVSSAVYCHGVHLEDEGHEVLTDNYFELIPGVSHRVPITVPVASGNYALTAVMPIGAQNSV